MESTGEEVVVTPFSETDIKEDPILDDSYQEPFEEIEKIYIKEEQTELEIPDDHAVSDPLQLKKGERVLEEETTSLSDAPPIKIEPQLEIPDDHALSDPLKLKEEGCVLEEETTSPLGALPIKMEPELQIEGEPRYCDSDLDSLQVAGVSASVQTSYKMCKRGFFNVEVECLLTNSDSDDECNFPSSSDEDCSPSTSQGQAHHSSRSTSSPSTSETDDDEGQNGSTQWSPPVIKRGKSLHSFQWQKKEMCPVIHNFDASNSGVNLALPDNCSALDIFEKFFTTDLVSLIVEETNRYYKYIEENITIQDNSRINRWRDTCVDELYCFLAVTLLMPRVEKLSIADYWSKDPLLHTPIFREIMPRDRYQLLLRMLHFCDNSVPSQGDRLFKIRRVISYVKEKFKSALTPFQNVCIGESLLLFKGRLSFKKYIPSKRSRFGIKTFVLCDCETGFVLDFLVYTGVTTEIETSEDYLGKSGSIVTTLLKPYMGQGHTLFVDNWYTSPLLFQYLHERGTNAVGTVRMNRKDMPKLERRLKKGELEVRSTDTLMVLKWHNKRDMCMLTTCHTAEMASTGKRKRQSNDEDRKPKCVTDYNQRMGAVYKCHTFLSAAECVRKSAKWYKKFFFHILDVCVLNSHVIYKVQTGKNVSMSEFHLTLIRELLQKYHHETTKSGGRRSEEKNPLRLQGRHFPSSVESSCKGNSPVRRCVVCSKNNKRRESRYCCKQCDVGLCVVPCFEVYHTKKNV